MQQVSHILESRPRGRAGRPGAVRAGALIMELSGYGMRVDELTDAELALKHGRVPITERQPTGSYEAVDWHSAPLYHHYGLPGDGRNDHSPR